MMYFLGQITPFVVLMQGGRVGSSYLVTALDSHPSVRAYGEILVGEGREHQMRVAHRVLRHRIVSTKKATGFKTKLTDLADPEQFADLLTDVTQSQ